jgi:hypothetical protein
MFCCRFLLGCHSPLSVVIIWKKDPLLRGQAQPSGLAFTSVVLTTIPQVYPLGNCTLVIIHAEMFDIGASIPSRSYRTLLYQALLRFQERGDNQHSIL